MSCQDNMTMDDDLMNITVDDGLIDDEITMLMTEDPIEDGELISAESEAPSAEDTFDGTETTLGPDDSSTIAPTMDETMVLADDGASGNETDAVQQVVTDVPATMTEAPTVMTGAPTVMMTAAPSLRTQSPTAMTQAPTTTMTQATTTMDEEVAINATINETTEAPTESPIEDDTTTTTTLPPVPSQPAAADTPECAVQVSNTEEVCGELLKTTTADCDCYNFCSGKLIACLDYGERNSFSCSGETVAGCTTEQRVISAASQQRMLTALSAFLTAALPALVLVV